jgi:hypothetical protein
MSRIAPEAFMEYFRANYPGPNTVITTPDWHAPKIYAAALAASGHRELLEAARLSLDLCLGLLSEVPTDIGADAREFVQQVKDACETAIEKAAGKP